MQKDDERGVALLLALLVLALLVALILEFDGEARREYRDAAAFRDNFKAQTLTRAAIQAARAVLQQDFIKDKKAGEAYDAPTDVWAFPIKNYAIGDDRMLMVASDRLSAFDVIMSEPIPEKGRVLTAMALFWFDILKDVVPNHLTGVAPESVVARAIASPPATTSAAAAPLAISC